MRITLSETPKTDFVAMRPKFIMAFIKLNRINRCYLHATNQVFSRNGPFNSIIMSNFLSLYSNLLLQLHQMYSAFDKFLLLYTTLNVKWNLKTVPLFVLAVVDMACTLDSQCTDVLANTICSSSQCACVRGYTGTTCTGNTSISYNERPKTCLPIATNLSNKQLISLL